MSVSTEPCKLCSGKTEILDKPAKPVYYHCPHCDLIFMGDMFLPDSQEEFERYKLHNNSLENQGYVKYLSDFLKDAEIDKMKNVEPALDFGCGPEPVLKILLSRQGVNADIYDPYFFPARVYTNKKYNLITSTEVLEHLNNPLSTLILLESLLAEEGVLAVKTLFHTTSQDFDKWWYRRDKTHICFYSPKTFHWIANKLKLKIKKMDNSSICILGRQ